MLAFKMYASSIKIQLLPTFLLMTFALSYVFLPTSRSAITKRRGGKQCRTVSLVLSD